VLVFSFQKLAHSQKKQKTLQTPKKILSLASFVAQRVRPARGPGGPLVKLYQIENKCGAVQSGPCREPWVASINSLAVKQKTHKIDLKNPVYLRIQIIRVARQPKTKRRQELRR
jgi:hypothetical protein